MGTSCVVALDTDPHARQRATELGADLALDPGEGDPAREVRERLGISPLDVGHPVVTSEAMLIPVEST